MKLIPDSCQYYEYLNSSGRQTLCLYRDNTACSVYKQATNLVNKTQHGKSVRFPEQIGTSNESCKMPAVE